MADQNHPIDTLRDGALKATIWENEGEKGSFFSVTLARTYTDREGRPRDTSSFSSNELLRVAELSRNAYTRTNELRREFSREAERENASPHDNNRTGERQTSPERDRAQSRRPRQR